MATLRRLGAALLGAFATVVGLASQTAPATFDVQPIAARTLRIDGDLADWPDRPPDLIIDRESQVWSLTELGLPWRGTADLSGRIWLARDRAHLYVAGEVTDDDAVAGTLERAWHEQDAVELFFDLRPDRSEPDVAARIQFFIMPFSNERRWGRIDWVSQRPTGAGMTGVQVATVGTETGYRFEFAMPVCNVDEFVPGTAAIGFDVALDDRDAGTERYQYMTATGRNPTQTPALNCVLSVAEGVPLGAVLEPRGEGVFAWLQSNAFYLLVPLGGGVLLVLLLRVWGAFERKLPRLRVLARVVGVALFVAALLLPAWLVAERRAERQVELLRVAEVLRDAIPAMEQGVLGSYGGEQRDQALATLLKGGAIARERRYETTSLRALQMASSEPAPRPVELDFSVLPYGIPLQPEQVQRFEFREPIPLGTLNVAVARTSPTDRGFGTRAAPSLTVTAIPFDPSFEPQSASLECSGTYFEIPELVEPGFEVSFRSFALSRPTRAITISEPRTGGGDGELRLVGLTWVAPDKTREQPLPLGEPSLAGIDTELRGPWPRGAGFEIQPGGAHVIESPTDAAFDKLWLFYRASYLGRPTTTRVGETVCELRLSEKGSREARLIEFDHQESMFFELELQNRDLPEVGDVQVALRWQDEDQEARVNFVREIDLGAAIERMEFRNVGQYPVRFRAVVFGREVRSIATSAEDSPLEPLGASGEERLSEAFRARLGSAQVALYRGGRVTASTFEEGAVASAGFSGVALEGLPPDRASGDVISDFVERDGAIEHRAFARINGGDWGGAVVGVFTRDAGDAGYTERVHRVGAALSLLTAPILLHVLSLLLAALGSLRLRLLALFGVVMLVPLGVLSVVLVQVLENGHDEAVRRRLEQRANGATEALARVAVELQDATQTWVRELAARVEATGLEGPALFADLRSRMQSQMPPAWGEDGGFLQFDFTPTPALRDGGALERSVYVGSEALRALESPVRNDPSVYVAWGVPFVGVRAALETEAGTASLSAGRRMDRALLERLIGGGGGEASLILCGMNGYPLAVAAAPREAGAAEASSALERDALDPQTIATRKAIATAVVTGGRPILGDELASGADGARWVASYDVLRDLQETPRALLAVLEPFEGAALALRMGRVPVRAFFAVIGGLLVLASVFLGWVMTRRITRPIERLELGARALSRGQLDVRVQTDERGQIGRLTDAFNNMAGELHARIEDLHVLNRGIRDLTAKLELEDVVTSAVAFYVRATAADRVALVLLDRNRERVELHGSDGALELDRDAADVRQAFAGVGPFSMRLTATAAGRPAAFVDRYPDCRSAVVLPLSIAGRTRGAVMLMFQTPVPQPVDLELLTTMSVQVAAAIQNAWLFSSAVQDLATGAYHSEHFAGKVARAIQDGGSVKPGGATGGAAPAPIVLVGLRIDGGLEIARSVGAAQHGRLLEAVLGVARDAFGVDAIAGRMGDDELRLLVVASADDLVQANLDARCAAVAADASRVVAAALPVGLSAASVRVAAAVYPRDAASAAFLGDVLKSRLDVPGKAIDAVAAGADGAPGALQHRLATAPATGLFVDGPAMGGVFRTLERVAPSDITLLIEGETGVGKEVLANLVHAWSRRAAGPLVKVHCAALPESLLSSELFGHEKGAFTGAHERSIGRFEQADGGTIFLDEIGEISLDVQVRLLRVLQEREIERVGGSRPIPVDVRVLAATHRNIEEMVAAGTFREDLYYRLQGMVIVVPPLRERKQEIPLLVEYFREQAADLAAGRVLGFAPEAMDELFRRDWPGNIRELRNVVHRSMVLANGSMVTLADLVGRPEQASSIGVAAPPAIDLPEDAVPSARDLGEGIGANDAPSSPAAAARGHSEGDPAPRPSLTPRLARLVQLLDREGPISSTEYAKAAGLSPRTALRDLNQLLEWGLAIRHGERRGARYSPSTERKSATRS